MVKDEGTGVLRDLFVGKGGEGGILKIKLRKRGVRTQNGSPRNGMACEKHWNFTPLKILC